MRDVVAEHLKIGGVRITEPCANRVVIGRIYTTFPSTVPLKRHLRYVARDPRTRDWRSHIQAKVLPRGKTLRAERVKAELHHVVEDLKMVAPAKLIFGLRVHVGVEGQARHASCTTPPSSSYHRRAPTSSSYSPVTRSVSNTASSPSCLRETDPHISCSMPH